MAGAARFSSGARISGIEPGSLATTGLYRHIRNPEYLGLTAMLAGLALYLSGKAASAWQGGRCWWPRR